MGEENTQEEGGGKTILRTEGEWDQCPAGSVSLHMTLFWLYEGNSKIGCQW